MKYLTRFLCFAAWVIAQIIPDLFSKQAWAQETAANPLYSAAVSSKPGAMPTLYIYLDVEEAPRALEFNVVLPEGVEFVKSNATSANYDFVKSSRISSTFIITHSTPAGEPANVSKVMVVSYSSATATIKAGTGKLLGLPLKVSPSMKRGSYQIAVTSKVIRYATKEKPADTSSKFTVKYVIGDADLDGTLTTSDAAMIVDALLEKSLTGFSPSAADANLDGEVSLSDVTTVISRIQ